MDGTDNVGKKQNTESMWTILQKDIDLEPPTPSIEQVYLGCTEREGNVKHKAVQLKSELSEKRTTTRETEEIDQTEENRLSRKIITWSCDMKGHAKKCVERHCELVKKDVSFLERLKTPCIDDHLIPQEDF